ncbi:MAG: DNRLRE domain-containing protein [Verrucomicrobiales bacterium]|jgi:hypothetical protein|nr:DNRLRE domain-containing protein [Verrucomicrobiales bacterium]
MNIKTNMVGGVHILMVTALAVFGAASANADTMLMENGRNNYAGTVTGIGGNLTNAAWTGTSINYYRFGNSTDSGYRTTTLWRFNDSAGLGVGTIMSTATEHTVINSAELHLYATQSSITGGTFYVAPIMSDWTQASAEGKDVALPTIDTSKAVSVVIASFTSGNYYVFDASAIVQNWVDSDYTNYGFAVYALDDNVFVSQVSNEYRSNLGQRPQLYIDYTITIIPEPTTWFLLTTGAALLVALRYKRRAS